ncbi:MAG: M20/M25/M40 family metallo-hydrolase [Gemmatimonadota bacterium]|nr:M20/M25/M40 family metallo-hydrolase [Gemmatimonadota bacterium]
MAQAPLPASGSPLPAEYQRLAREVIAEAVGTNTQASNGSTTVLARKIRARLIAAGYPASDIQMVGAVPKTQNLIVRLRGLPTGKKPILLASHLDVVEARAADWSMDPFTLNAKNGFLLGRGVEDNKAGVTTVVTNLIRWKREQWVPDRDIIAYFSANEEGDAENGIIWVLKNRRALIDAEFALNTDAGGVELANGKPRAFGLQASEKVYVTYRLEAVNPGGHSSRPRADNAIYTLAAALTRLGAYRFPVMLNEISRAQLERAATLAPADTAADMRAVAANPADSAAVARLTGDPGFNTMLRTTCVATMLEGGHAENALPQRARATVNCRVLPNHKMDEVVATLQRIAGDSVAVTQVYAPVASDASPLRDDLLRVLGQLVPRFFPGATLVPLMEAGATDGLYLRNAGIPTYGVSAIAAVSGESNAHGRDEKLRERSLYDATEFWYSLVKKLASPTVTP